MVNTFVVLIEFETNAFPVKIIFDFKNEFIFVMLEILETVAFVEYIFIVCKAFDI